MCLQCVQCACVRVRARARVPYAVHFIMCAVCVYSNPSLSRCSYITADTDNTIFMFNEEVNTVVFVLASYHKSFHQTVCCTVLALLLCVQDIPGFKFIQDTQYSGCDSYFSQPLDKNYSESMIVHYSRPEELLSDLPNESSKIILSFSKHTLDSIADMADIPVSDRLTWWRSSMCYRQIL